jgi:hypothetical protein
VKRQAEPLSTPMHDAIGEVLGRCGDDQLKFLSQILQELCDAVKKAAAQLNATSDSPAEKRRAFKGVHRPKAPYPPP